MNAYISTKLFAYFHDLNLDWDPIDDFKGDDDKENQEEDDTKDHPANVDNDADEKMKRTEYQILLPEFKFYKGLIEERNKFMLFKQQEARDLSCKKQTQLNGKLTIKCPGIKNNESNINVKQVFDIENEKSNQLNQSKTIEAQLLNGNVNSKPNGLRKPNVKNFRDLNDDLLIGLMINQEEEDEIYYSDEDTGINRLEKVSTQNSSQKSKLDPIIPTLKMEKVFTHQSKLNPIKPPLKPKAQIRFKPSLNNNISEPTNIMKYNGLMVRNISSRCSKKMLENHFCEFGNVSRIRIDSAPLDQKQPVRCFINYTDPVSSIQAIKSFRNKSFEDIEDICYDLTKPLSFRFTPSYMQIRSFKYPLRKEIIQKSVEREGECYFWRHSGRCMHHKGCQFAHHPVNKSIDNHYDYRLR